MSAYEGSVSESASVDAGVGVDDQDTTASPSDNLEQVSDAPMIGAHISPLALRPEYESNPLQGFIVGIEYLSRQYSSMRRVRPDGNCFYRAFLYSYLDTLRQMRDIEYAVDEKSRFLRLINESKEKLEALGYMEYTYEEFLTELVSLVEGLFSMSAEQLMVVFTDGTSDYYTWFMRLLTAMGLKSDPETYMPYLIESGSLDLASFCRSEVEPMGIECDHLQVAAITKVLGLRVNIEYLDGRVNPDNSLRTVSIDCRDEIVGGGGGGDEAKVQDINPDQQKVKTVTLLYRPGHYDILYPA